MNHGHFVSSELAGYDAVNTALSSFHAGDVVSTSATLNTIRRLAPDCRESDAELVTLIVSLATARMMGVAFDISPINTPPVVVVTPHNPLGFSTIAVP